MTAAAGRLRAPAGHHSSGSQVRQSLRRGAPSRTAYRVVPWLTVPLGPPS